MTGSQTDLQRHRPDRQHQLQLPRPRHRRRRQPQPLLQHRHHHHTAPGLTPPTAPGRLTATAAGSSEIDLGWRASTRQRRRHRLPRRALPGPAAAPSPRSAPRTRDDLQRHRPSRPQHQLQLPRPRHRRRRQPQPLLQHRHHDHTGQAGTAGLVAAYGFDEGSGTTVADASGNGNNGDDHGRDLDERRASTERARSSTDELAVDVPDAASLHLTTGMTLEAWVNPSRVTRRLARRDLQGQRQLLPGRDLAERGRPAGGGTIGGRHLRRRLASSPAQRTRGRISPVTYDGSTVRLYVNGTQVATQAATGNDRHLDQPAPDRRRQPLRPVLRRARSTKSASTTPPSADPDLFGHTTPVTSATGAGTGTSDRERRSPARRST